MNAPSSRRVGLLGGTFDPPHLGHLVVAEEARVELGLDEVAFVVAGAPWMKDDCSPAEDRVRMAELATDGVTGLTVDRTEVDREGPTYTADTLEERRASEPDADLFFLVGADAARRLGEWKRVDQALALARFVVVTRPGFPLDLEPPWTERVEILQVPPIGISSTDLRRRFREGGAVRFQVPDAVLHYVREHRLYTIEERV